MSPPLLLLEGVSYRYPESGVLALDDVTLELEEGELVLVAGESASGKSTLLRAAAGLVPHFHGGELAGRVLVAGMDTRRFGPARLAAVAASVFQDPEAQVVMGTAGAELALPLENRGFAGATVARAVEETAVALGIERLLERPLHTLSGGELQRVALGAAIVTQPRLLLLDEPTSQLDPVAGDELVWQLRRLNDQWGTTVLLAEHRVERCLGAADRVVVLKRGRVACDAPPSEFVAWAERGAPELVPPAARMCALAGLRPLPVGVRDARALVDDHGLAAGDATPAPVVEPRFAGRRRSRAARRARPPVALSLEHVWVTYDDGSGAGLEALRDVSLELGKGESVALLGRNGAGKSTLLKVAAGVLAPQRGRVGKAGEVCLLLQSPGGYFLHESARAELPEAVAQAALTELGLEAVADADPRDLSGGERERLALGIVLAGRGVGGGEPPAVVALDEPTRGLDHGRKRALARRLRALSARGAAVIVSTHDVEFAATVAERCVLLGRGDVVADGPVRDVLSGGRYFATEVARVLGAEAGAVLAEQGAEVLAARAAAAAPAADEPPAADRAPKLARGRT
jgi:energy-coupling factor transporter ATP-binding protein EcfA2